MRLRLLAVSVAATALLISYHSALHASPARSYTPKELDATVVSFESKKDRFTGLEVRRLTKPVMLKGGASIGFPATMFDLLLTVTEEGDSAFTIQLVHLASSWAFLTGRVVFLLDGDQRLELGQQGDQESQTHRQVSGRYVQEIVALPLDCESLAALAAASKIEAKLSGGRTDPEVWFPKEALAAFRQLRVEVGCPPR